MQLFLALLILLAIAIVGGFLLQQAVSLGGKLLKRIRK